MSSTKKIKKQALRAKKAEEQKQLNRGRKESARQHLQEKEDIQLDQDLAKIQQEEEEEKKKGIVVFWKNNKKIVCRVFVAAAIIGTTVVGSYLGLSGHFKNDDDEKDKPSDPTTSMTDEPTLEPIATPTATPSVRPTDDPEPTPTATEGIDEPIESAKPGRPARPNTSTPEIPSEDPEPSETHECSVAEWKYYDEKYEIGVCTECGQVHYRNHSIEHYITFEKASTNNKHQKIDETHCSTCDYKKEVTSYEDCSRGKIDRYDDYYEYSVCPDCGQSNKFKHNLVNGECTNDGCDYKKSYTDNNWSSNPSPSPEPSETPGDGRNPSDSGNIGDSGMGDVNIGGDPSESLPPDIEINTPDPTLPPDIEINTPDPTLPPDIEINTPEPTVPGDIEINTPESTIPEGIEIHTPEEQGDLSANIQGQISLLQQIKSRLLAFNKENTAKENESTRHI